MMAKFHGIPKVIAKDQSEAAIAEALRKERQEREEEHYAIKEIQKDFYSGLQFLDKYLYNYGFNKEKFPPHACNITRKVIDKISLTYKRPPERNIGGGEKDKYAIFFNKNRNIDVALKEAERMKHLLGVVLFRPHWDDKGKTWQPFIETNFKAWFTEENTLYPFAYSIPLKHDVRGNKVVAVKYVFWSKEEYFYYDEDGDKSFDPNHPEGKNPFGIIPYVEMRDNIPVDEYGEYGALDLVNANQAININLMNLNYMIHYQAHNYPHITGVNADDVTKVGAGADDWTVISKSGAEVNIGALDLNPKIAETIDAIKFQIQQIAWSYNLAINWTIEGNAPSGFSLVVQNIDLLEAREDDIEVAKMQEQKLYQIISRITNTVKGYPVSDKVPENKELNVNFEEMKFPINDADRRAEREWKIKNNMATPIKYIMEDEDVTKEDAEKLYEEYKAVNKKLSAADIIRANLRDET